MPAELHGIKSSDIHTKIKFLINALVNIKDDTGEFLMTLEDGRVIDTKGWNDWEWTQYVFDTASTSTYFNPSIAASACTASGSTMS